MRLAWRPWAERRYVAHRCVAHRCVARRCVARRCVALLAHAPTAASAADTVGILPRRRAAEHRALWGLLRALWGGLRAFLRGSIIGGIFRTLIGLFILSWLMM